jgi:hypothetical protein
VRATPIRGIGECDVLRERIHEHLKGMHPQLTLDVIFTADKRWLGLEDSVRDVSGKHQLGEKLYLWK